MFSSRRRTRTSTSASVRQTKKPVCWLSIGDLVEWTLVLLMTAVCVCNEIFGPLPFMQLPSDVRIPSSSDLYWYPYITSSISLRQWLSLTLLPMSAFLIVNIFALKLTSFYQFMADKAALRAVEIAKNRRNESNHLRVFDDLYDHKYDLRRALSVFLTVCKATLFALSATHLVCLLLKTFILAPRPYFNAHADLDSFPDIIASDCMSVNFLLSLCMLSAFRFAQSAYSDFKCRNVARVDIMNDCDAEDASFRLRGNHCYHGRVYFGLSLWCLMRDHKLASMTLVCVPLSLPFYLGMLQIVEFQHFPTDVMTGYAVGMFCASIAYVTYFDDLVHEIRIPSLSEMLYIHLAPKSKQSYASVDEEQEVSRLEVKYSVDVTADKQKPNKLKRRHDTRDEYEYDPRREGDYSLPDLEAIAFRIASNAAAARPDTFDGVECTDMDDDAYDLEEEEDEEQDQTDNVKDTEHRSLRICNIASRDRYKRKRKAGDLEVQTNSISSETECNTEKLANAIRKGLKLSASPSDKRLHSKVSKTESPVANVANLFNEQASLIPHHYVE